MTQQFPLPPALEGITIVRLTDGSRSRILAHLLRLPADDRRMRFMRCMPDVALEAYVASLDFVDAVRLGICDRLGAIVAMVEGFILADRTGMEVAFSTDPGWRRLGLAQALEREIAATAHRLGVGRIVACCSSRNMAMKALLQCCEAETEQSGDEVTATWRPAPAVTQLKGSLAFDRYVPITEEQTARRQFAALPLGAAYAERLVPALATGVLVATIESACIAEMQPFLAVGETVVGVNVDLCHVGPALPGSSIRLRGTGQWCDGRQAGFDVNVDDEHGRIATARVVMAVVAAARFAAGLARKGGPVLLAA